MVSGRSGGFIRRNAGKRWRVDTARIEVGRCGSGPEDTRVQPSLDRKVCACGPDIGGGEHHSLDKLLLYVKVPLLHVCVYQVGIERFTDRDGQSEDETSPRLLCGWWCIREWIANATMWIGETVGLRDGQNHRIRLSTHEPGQLIEVRCIVEDAIGLSETRLSARKRRPGEAEPRAWVVPIVAHTATRHAGIAHEKQPAWGVRIDGRLLPWAKNRN